MCLHYIDSTLSALSDSDIDQQVCWYCYLVGWLFMDLKNELFGILRKRVHLGQLPMIQADKRTIVVCKAKRQHLLTLQVRRCCLLALQGGIVVQ